MINGMIIIEAILVTVLVTMCIYVTITDFKQGIIQNKVLIVAGIVGLAANIPYYLIYSRTYFIAFLLNLIIMSIISIMFYALHIWAAGDSKLLILTIFLMPARLYYQGNNVTATVVIMIIIFSIAYLYIIGESIILGIKERNLFRINRFKADVKLMIKQYIKCTCLVSLFGIIVRFVIPEFYDKNIALIMILNMIIVLMSYNFKFLDKTIPLISLSVTTGICYFLTSNGMFQFDYKIYLLVFVVFILRLFAEKYNYQTIPTSKVEKGMVIALSTTLCFVPSNIKGLPKEKNTEDIRSRITAEEAESIKRWEFSKYGQSEIVIVRKIPFAIFISIGSIIYIFSRMLMG